MFVFLLIVGIIGGLFCILAIFGLICYPFSIYCSKKEEKNPFEKKKVVFVFDDKSPKNADGVNGYLEAVGETKPFCSFYCFWKRLFDIVISFFALIILSPVFLIISILIFFNDPGPVIFVQKRVGKNKRFFKLHKFRSMKMSTPHDTPTHMLEDPNRYITRVGKFLRSHSLDELPQIWDIFIGNMSIIGPRPALWNQDLLISERDKYGANSIKPGLTGWAQINGRDELSIDRKAELDGYYMNNYGLPLDIKCFFGSIHVFHKDDSVIEGSKKDKNDDK